MDYLGKEDMFMHTFERNKPFVSTEVFTSFTSWEMGAKTKLFVHCSLSNLSFYLWYLWMKLTYKTCLQRLVYSMTSWGWEKGNRSTTWIQLVTGKAILTMKQHLLPFVLYLTRMLDMQKKKGPMGSQCECDTEKGSLIHWEWHGNSVMKLLTGISYLYRYTMSRQLKTGRVQCFSGGEVQGN